MLKKQPLAVLCAVLLGFTPQFTIYDEDDRLALIKRLLERSGYSPKGFPPQLIQSLISQAKNRLQNPDQLEAMDNDKMIRAAADIYRQLDVALRGANAMDFDDLLDLLAFARKNFFYRVARKYLVNDPLNGRFHNFGTNVVWQFP